MENFLSELGSIYWWISVVFVGIIINIISGFGFKYINSFFEKFSDKRKIARINQEKENLEKVKELKENDIEKMIQSSLILNLRLQANTSLLYTILCFLPIAFILFGERSNAITDKVTLMVFILPFSIFLLSNMFRTLKYIRESRTEESILCKARKEDKENQ